MPCRVFRIKFCIEKQLWYFFPPWLVYLFCCTPLQNMNIQWMTHCRLQLTPPLSPMLQCSVHSTSCNVISYYWQPLPLWRSMYWTLNPFIWSEQNISLKMDTCLFFSVHNVCFSCPMREYKFLILDFLSQATKIILELNIQNNKDMIMKD